MASDSVRGRGRTYETNQYLYLLIRQHCDHAGGSESAIINHTCLGQQAQVRSECLTCSFRATVARKEGRSVLFNDAHNTFYLRLYGVGHMVKDHSESDRGNPLPPHELLFPISSKGSFYIYHPTDRIRHTTAFVTPVVEREIAQWVHSMKDRSDDPPHHERTILPRSYISLPGARIDRLYSTH